MKPSRHDAFLMIGLGAQTAPVRLETFMIIFWQSFATLLFIDFSKKKSHSKNIKISNEITLKICKSSRDL